jgi:hypothetical protein
MHCCIAMRQAENNILASPESKLPQTQDIEMEARGPDKVSVSFIDLLKTNRREIQGGHAKLREIIFPQKYVWITCKIRRPNRPKMQRPNAIGPLSITYNNLFKSRH